MAATAQATTRTAVTTDYIARKRWRDFTLYALVTLIGLVVLTIFLAPLGYMILTSLKDNQQIIDPNAQFLPSRPVKFNYEGKDYTIYRVPTAEGEKQWALVEPFREESNFVDPENPNAGLINWKGRWRTLKPMYRFEPFTGNFALAWAQINFLRLLNNTFIIAALGTIGTVLASTAVAYGFARFRFPFKNTMFLILIATIILPSQVTLIPQYVFFRSIGWGGTWWPLIIPHFFANAYNVFLLRQYFMSIPKEMDEAAWIDGANPLQTLLYVILPQSLPAITAVAMFHFFFAWNDFFTPLVYLSGREDMYTISVGLTQFNNAFGSQPGQMMAAAMMALALPVIIFFLAQRQFMQGVVMTGVDK
jgi:multiple sugar transport system permease protein